MNDEEVMIKLENQSVRILNIEHCIENLGKGNQAMHDLVLSVNELAINMKNMLQEQKDQGERLKKLEGEPVEQLKSVRLTVLTAIISALAGTFVTGLIAVISGYI